MSLRMFAKYVMVSVTYKSIVRFRKQLVQGSAFTPVPKGVVSEYPFYVLAAERKEREFKDITFVRQRLQREYTGPELPSHPKKVFLLLAVLHFLLPAFPATRCD